MAVSACPHCQNQSFEIQEAKTDGAGQPLLFVQCARCGAPAGVVESRAMLLLQEQDARLKNLERQIAAIESGVAHIRHVVGALANQSGY